MGWGVLFVCTTGGPPIFEGILYPLALSISVITFLFKKSVVDYNIIGLVLQANYPHGSGKFSHNGNQYLVYKKWEGVCYWCAQPGVHQVWEGILYPPALSKSIILLLSKKSLVGYNLIGLGSQANYPYGSGKFSHNGNQYLAYNKWDEMCYWCAQPRSTKFRR